MKHKAISIIVAVFAILTPVSVFSQEAGGIDQKVNEIFNTVFGPFVSFIFYSVSINGVSFPLIVGWLIICAFILTVYMGFIQFTGIRHSIDLLRGVYSNPEDAGEVSHFQALATALSGTVGLGNIAGVAVAVSLGGPGATFWMIVAGFAGMASKFTECTLGVKYRDEFPDGHVSGGPMYYLSKGLAEKGKAGLGKVLAVLFAIMCIFGSFGGGNMFQGNQAYQMMANTLGIFTDTGWLFGLILAIIVGAVIIGGIKSSIGSAAIAHSAVRTKEPLTEGYVALLEPFIDTVVICTMTALVIVITGTYADAGGMTGVALTSAAFQSVFPWFGVILAVAVLLFAFSTMISWSYYGLKCWTFLFGEGRVSELVFKFIFCVFVMIGCSMSLGPVIDFSDAAIFAMSLGNVLGLYLLMGIVKKDLKDYQSRLKSGEKYGYAILT
ncbi:MAG: alanine:cation symporter family protein [Desulfobacterales bacterium]